MDTWTPGYNLLDLLHTMWRMLAKDRCPSHPSAPNCQKSSVEHSLSFSRTCRDQTWGFMSKKLSRSITIFFSICPRVVGYRKQNFLEGVNQFLGKNHILKIDVYHPKIRYFIGVDPFLKSPSGCLKSSHADVEASSPRTAKGCLRQQPKLLRNDLAWALFFSYPLVI